MKKLTSFKINKFYIIFSLFNINIEKSDPTVLTRRKRKQERKDMHGPRSQSRQNLTNIPSANLKKTWLDPVWKSKEKVL